MNNTPPVEPTLLLSPVKLITLPYVSLNPRNQQRRVQITWHSFETWFPHPVMFYGKVLSKKGGSDELE